eukprot:scaffold244241_cov40-Prasinocladus_malaysianus.AAC.1
MHLMSVTDAIFFWVRAFGDIKNLVGQMRNTYISGKEGKSIAAPVPPPERRLQRRESTTGVSSVRAQTALDEEQGTVGPRVLGRCVSASASTQRAVPAAVPSSRAQQLPDIDSVDTTNPLAASEYACDIYKFYHRIEKSFMVSSTYMSNQTEISSWMRSVLVDWLVEVHLKFKLSPETLYLTVNIIDRFLAVRHVGRKQLQLVGVTAMFLAAKYEETWAPEVRDFVYICDKAYSRKQILVMERTMINVLQFKITVPTHHHFAARYVKAAGLEKDKEFMFLCRYIIELSLLEYDMLEHSYSEVSAAAVQLALKLTGYGESSWPLNCEKHSGYTKEALRTAVSKLYSHVTRAGPDAEMPSVYKKYCSPKFAEIAKLP